MTDLSARSRSLLLGTSSRALHGTSLCVFGDIFNRSHDMETLQLNSDALALAFRPDGQELAASTLDGQVSFFEVDEGKLTGLIEGRRDVAGGRNVGDRTTAANNTSGKMLHEHSVQCGWPLPTGRWKQQIRCPL